MRRLISILLMLAVYFEARAEAPAEPLAQPQPQYNFLFVVDASTSMSSRKPAISALAHDLILSGFFGQIGSGDSIDIWTFDSETHLTGFPPQIWNTNRAGQIASTAAEFISQSKFRGRSRFKPVDRDLRLLLPNTKGLMVFLFTDGDEKVSGTPFDAELNAHFERVKEQLPGSREPYMITLLAVNGVYKDWRIFGGLGRPLLPQLPSREISLGKILSVQKVERIQNKPAETNIVAAAVKKAEPKPPVVFNFPPGAVVVPPPAPEPVPVPPAATVKAAKTAEKVQPQIARTAAGATNSTVIEKTVLTAAIPTLNPVSRVEGAATRAENLETNNLGESDIPVIQKETEATPRFGIHAAQPKPVETEESSWGTLALVCGAAGGGFVSLFAGSILLARKKRLARQPSLISKSLGR
jgi:hypothetical protein